MDGVSHGLRGVWHKLPVMRHCFSDDWRALNGVAPDSAVDWLGLFVMSAAFYVVSKEYFFVIYSLFFMPKATIGVILFGDDVWAKVGGALIG